MVAGARTFGLEDTFLDPQILNPPPTRHALLAFLLVLAALLHIGTAGWGDLYDGEEGQLAGGAREMLESRQWLVPTNNGVPQLQTPPLSYWTIALSYKIFGVTVTAARIPVALAMVASVALTFLIGERLAGYWRGFAAGLIHLCSGGAFLLARMVTHDALFALFIAGAIYCVVCGYQHRKFRWAWFAGVWFCAGLACLTKGPGAILYLGGVCLLLAVLFREARMRFRLLLHWSYLLLFLAIAAPWFVWAQNRFPGFLTHSLISGSGAALPRWPFVLLHSAWWFPTLFLILPGLLLAPRKIFRPREFSFAEALPLCWIAVGIVPFLFIGEREGYSSMSAWPAFALFAASAWERTSLPFRMGGLALVLLMAATAAAIVGFVPTTPEALRLNALSWSSLRPMTLIASISLLAFSLPALYFVIRQRDEIALFLVVGSMVPIGFCLAESAARVAPLFSLADAARFLNPRLGQQGQVLYEGPLRSANSLSFYLNKRFFLVNQTPGSFEQDAASQHKHLDEHFVLDAWEGANPIYLIIEQDRVAHWRRLIIDRVHIYHQVTTCGTRVVLSNEL